MTLIPCITGQGLHSGEGRAMTIWQLSLVGYLSNWDDHAGGYDHIALIFFGEPGPNHWAIRNGKEACIYG